MKKKLFGDKVERINKEELHVVYNEIKNKIYSFYSNYVCYITGDAPVYRISKTISLPNKETFGDVDILLEIDLQKYPLYYNKQWYELKTSDIQKFLFIILDHKSNYDDEEPFELSRSHIKEYSKNTYIHSIIYYCEEINKCVHVDFIVNSPNSKYDLFKSRYQYFCFNDFSGILGIMSKKLNFKYGSEGFFKRYRDKKGNWHDIFLSDDLWGVGLRCLGYNPKQLENIKCENNIVEFIMDSQFFDSSYFEHENMNQSDKKSYKRPAINMAVDKLRDCGIKRTCTNNDFFLHLHFPALYDLAWNAIEEIDRNVYTMSTKYNGQWLIDTFDLKQGPQIGFILKQINLHYDNESNEQTVIEFVNKLIKEEQ